MNQPVEAFRDYVSGQYKAFLNDEAWDIDNVDNLSGDTPNWQWQTEHLDKSSDSSSKFAGLLLEPDIGICLYAIDFENVPDVKKAISKAISIRQKLLPSFNSKSEEIDKFGSWRIILHWLVKEGDLTDWINAIADVRENTGYFEEVSADVIVGSDGEWEQAISSHGIPRLLLKTRKTLKQRNLEEIEEWQSADRPVEMALRNLTNEIIDEGASTCLSELLEAVIDKRDFQPKAQQSFYNINTRLNRLKLANFRNLQSLDINFKPSSDTVNMTVIHGPNGSGKSTVFEAISVALSQTSQRHLNYIRDKNRKILGSDHQYLSDYLTPFSSEKPTGPKLELNDEDINLLLEQDTDTASAKVQQISNNMFSQELSDLLVTMPSNELGAEITGAFSELAKSATEYSDIRFSEARIKQQAFNNEWGLRGNVTKLETVLKKLVERELNERTGFIADARGWLRYETRLDTKITNELKNWNQIFETYDSNRESLSLEVAKLWDKGSDPSQFLSSEFKSLSNRYRDFQSFAENVASSLSQFDDEFLQKIELYGLWLESKQKSPSLETAEQTRLQNALNDVERLQEICSSQGKLLREQKDSLDKIAQFLPNWHERENECPTCLTDLSDRGGIRVVVANTLDQVNSRLDELRLEFQKLSAKQKEITAKLSSSGVGESPLDAESQSHFGSTLKSIIGAEANVNSLIGEPISRREVIALLSHLRRVPRMSFPSSIGENAADQIIAKLREVEAEFDRVSQAPKNWKTVRDAVFEKLTNVASEHLPKTIQGLWVEISQNMLPAPWQYPGSAELFVRPNKSNAEIAVVLTNGRQKRALAAYILNGAEVHNLGLAWFFTKYLTKGRFQLNAMVLDDPAQAMDQPTFREFCRLLETFMRMHRKRQIPLSLALLMHQDSRALDAVRATNGLLHNLRWNKQSTVMLHKLKLHDDSIGATSAKSLLTAMPD